MHADTGTCLALGLSIARYLVEAQGGTLRASSSGSQQVADPRSWPPAAGYLDCPLFFAIRRLRSAD